MKFDPKMKNMRKKLLMSKNSALAIKKVQQATMVKKVNSFKMFKKY